MIETFDYIIVGAGSAGCVVANRLSQQRDVSVLLLEAGPPPLSPWIRMPAGMSKLLLNASYNWQDFTDAGAGQRAMRWVHGRTLGGSSATNALVYSRGAPHDYDGWAARGNTGWSWADVKPHFEAIERRFDGDSHASSGELAVSPIGIRHAGVDAFIAAGQSLGLPLDETPDRSREACIGRALMTTLDGARHSTADAFLKPASNRNNLTVRTDATVRRVLLQNKRAIGVEYGDADAVQRVFCRREVILCGGATNSPHLLLLSGIGPGAHLREHGIDVAVDLPGVGENLQDHMLLNCNALATPSLSLNRELRGLRLLKNGLHWLLTRGGPIGVGASQAYAFVRSRPDLAHPDLQINFRPFTIQLNRDGSIGINPRPGITLASALLHPHSRGRIALKSNDPAQRPAIHFDPLQAPADLAAHCNALRWMRRLLQAPSLAAPLSNESTPGAKVGDDDASIEGYVRASLSSMSHAAGTCRMGNDAFAVVDPQLRVHGVEGLRVADASIMPTVTSGNTNGPCILIGARGAELILHAARSTRAQSVEHAT